MASASPVNVMIWENDGTWQSVQTIDTKGADVHVDFSEKFLAIANGDHTVSIIDLTDFSVAKTLTLVGNTK